MESTEVGRRMKSRERLRTEGLGSWRPARRMPSYFVQLLHVSVHDDDDVPHHRVILTRFVNLLPSVGGLYCTRWPRPRLRSRI